MACSCSTLEGSWLGGPRRTHGARLTVERQSVVLAQNGPRGAGVTPFGAPGRESGTDYRVCAIGRRSSASRR